MNYKELAKQILQHVGGEKNVALVTHCATRLRFNLKDSQKANVNELKEMNGVLGVVEKGGQFQVVIGSDVPNVFKELNALGNFNSESSEVHATEQKSRMNLIFDTIAGIFTPFLPALTGAGMIKAVMAVLVAFKLISVESQIYAILNFIGDAAFYFMPIMLAYSAAQKFKTNPYLAMSLGGILLHPNFIGMVNTAKETGEPIQFIGINVPLVSYASSVIPIILSVWLMSYVYKLADKVSPKAVKFFLVPLITLVITTPVMLLVVGPLGNYIGQAVASGISFIDSRAGWVTPLIIGALNPLLVMAGMHYAIIPFGVNNLATLGYDTLVGPGMLVSNIAQGGATLAVAFKTKNKNLKQLASSAGITAVCGITEPAMYGVTMKLKRPLYAVMASGAIGGLVAGIFGVRRFMSGSPGLLTLPAYLGEPISNFGFALIACAVAFVAAFVLTLVFGFEDPAEQGKKAPSIPADGEEKESASDKKETVSSEVLKAPITGEIVALKDVNDATFATEVLGKGIAIKPENGTLKAPAAGTVITVYGTKHAICLRTDLGAEILLHVGLDTVQLEGKYFDSKVNEGDRVNAGDVLLSFDREKILSEGYDMSIPLIILNSDSYKDISSVSEGAIKEQEALLQLS